MTEVYVRYGLALDRLERMKFEIRSQLEVYESGEDAPTFEDVGRLFVFIENLKLERWAFSQELTELEEAVRELYVARDEKRGSEGEAGVLERVRAIRGEVEDLLRVTEKPDA